VQKIEDASAGQSQFALAVDLAVGFRNQALEAPDLVAPRCPGPALGREIARDGLCSSVRPARQVGQVQRPVFGIETNLEVRLQWFFFDVQAIRRFADRQAVRRALGQQDQEIMRIEPDLIDGV
jgi:hypothetical protein